MLGSMAFSVRAASVEDSPTQQQIEIAAGQRFKEVDMPDVAGDEPPSRTLLAKYAIEGRAWTAVDEEDRPLGYLLVSIVDGRAHIDQVSISPEAQGQGIGRAVIDQVGLWALRSGMTAITLTTFDSVPWNRPLYEHLGFRVLDDTEVGSNLRDLLEPEAALGLDLNLRVCMQLDLA
jgi:ribosomal protein S18 acetylase RimI-like enzyme